MIVSFLSSSHSFCSPSSSEVIVEEAETSDAEQQEMVIDKRWVVVDIAA